MLSINITIGANTAEFQKAITSLQQTVSSAAEKISDSFKSVGKAIDGARIHWEKFAAVSTAIRNTGRIVQELGSWLRTPLEQFSRFEDAATRLAQIDTPPGDPPDISGDWRRTGVEANKTESERYWEIKKKWTASDAGSKWDTDIYGR